MFFRKTILRFLVAFLMLVSTGLATERLVPSQYATIQAAIDAAKTGDTVIIAPGTYTGDGNRDIDFKGKAITIRSTDPNDPKIVAATVIDCEQQGRGFYLNGCSGAAISGLTITNGLADAGGGIYIEDSDVTIEKCCIVGSKTENGEDGYFQDYPEWIEREPTDGGHGGGIYCISSSLKICDCNISNNTTGSGGAAANCYYLSSPAGNGGNGGGIYCCDASKVRIRSCNIWSNQTGRGGNGGDVCDPGKGGDGGGIFLIGSMLEIIDCNIVSNNAGEGGEGNENGGNGGSGGGIYCGGFGEALIEHCIVTVNQAGGGGNGDIEIGGTGGHGGGICCEEHCSLEIFRSTLVENVAGNGAYPDSPGGKGGAVCCVSSLPLKVNGCVIYGNSSGGNIGVNDWSGGQGGHGGGIYCSSAVIKNSTIRNNSTADGGPDPDHADDGGDGGGIYCVDSLELVDCTIRNNWTGDGGDSFSWGGGGGGNGGGIWAAFLKATRCKIVENETGGSGEGGIHGTNRDGGNGGGVYCAETLLVSCEVTNNKTGDGRGGANSAGNGGDGAGLFCSGQASVIDSLFLSNATGSGGQQGMGCGDGGAGGAICCASATVTNCLIAGNTTGDGGSSMCGWPGLAGNGAGLYLYSASSLLEIKNCTIVGNVTGEYLYEKVPVQYVTKKGEGGGVYAGKNTIVMDSIIWGNSSDGLFGVDCSSVSYCDIQDSNCTGLNGNISEDPLFVPGSLGDYYLSQVAAGQQANSPCVNAGSDTAVTLGMDEFTTRADHARDKGVVDIGYHYPRVRTLGDISYDGFVDWDDLAILSTQWLEEPQDPSADVEPDGIIDFADFSCLGDNWLNHYGTPAENIYPANEATHVGANVILRWKTGDYAISHDVYFGRTYPPPFIGNQTSCFLDPGPLEFRTTYYWHVDEVSYKVIEGKIWGFTVGDFAGGEDENAPLLVTSAEDLRMIGFDPNYWDKHFKLVTDIDLAGYSSTDFNTIGWWKWEDPRSRPFTGIFDGNFHTISNLTYGPVDRDCVGLFGWVVDGRIMNLGMVDPNVSSTGGSLGALVGQLERGEITNCYVKGGKIIGTWKVGGLVGLVDDGLVSMCYSNTDVGAEGGDVGGLIGLNSFGDSITSRCYSTGHVSGKYYVGGLVGDNSSTISDCFSLCTVSGGSDVGGLLGVNSHWDATITNCYSAGCVSGTSNTGGLVGHKWGSVESCFWDTQASGQITSAAGIGKTTVEMMQQVTFEGWDFVNTWDIVENETYPFLRACGPEAASREIPMGEVVVDGDLSEWSEGVNWIPLDKVYYGDPADVIEAKYALRWSPDTDKIYVAVVVNDSNHIFSDEYIKWDASDRIEIYAQADALGGKDWPRIFDVAQQYMMGPNSSGGSWAAWAYGYPLGGDVGLEYAIRVDEKKLIYEAGVLMFDYYGGFAGGDTVVSDLQVGDIVGFDVIASSRWGVVGFGMLSENLMRGKSKDAGQFAEYVLVEELCGSGYCAADADLDASGQVGWPDLLVMADDWLWPGW